MLEQLRTPFPASAVKKNQDDNDYVSIDGYINRLIDVLGLNYDFTITQSTVELLPEDIKTSTGRRQYLATVTARLTLYTADSSPSRAGTGADISFDPDKAVKTAQAEALKKAAHQFGIALELWDEDHRKELETARQAAGGSEKALKKAVWDLAKKRLEKTKPTVAEVASVFDVKPTELSDKDTLQAILEREGVL